MIRSRIRTRYLMLVLSAFLLGIQGARSDSIYQQLATETVDKSHQGKAIDLSAYHVTFSDEFDKMSVTTERGKGIWYSPVHSDFGGSKFVGPSQAGAPVFVRDGNLVIQLRREGGGWTSSNVQTFDGRGHGFAQQYGYFEMRAKFELGMGAWYAFWLHSDPFFTGRMARQTEIDVVEAYGGSPQHLHSGIHLWPAPVPTGDNQIKWNAGDVTPVAGMFDGGYHTYGVDIAPDWVIFYHDRKELYRLRTLPDFQTPLYILVDLALVPHEAPKASSLTEMQVDYVRVWQRN